MEEPTTAEESTMMKEPTKIVTEADIHAAVTLFQISEI